MKMNKIINDPDDMIRDMLDGYLYLHGDLYTRVQGTMGGMIKRNLEEKVTILIGGGGGNEPWCLGYVGDGLADGMVSGNVYAAPPAKAVLDVSKEIYHQKGILYIGTNHMGDVLNFELVGELAELENIHTRCVFVNDDIASNLEEPKERRGIAGIALAVKIAGAATELGLDLEETACITQKAIDSIRTLSVTTSPGYMPANGKAMFEMPEGLIEYGMGFNGEPGILRENLRTAKEIVTSMMEMLIKSLDYQGEDLGVFLNGFGFTSIIELHIVMKEIKQYAERKGLHIYHADLQNAFCPQGMGGFSISLMKINEELKLYYNHEAESPLYKWKQL